MWHSLLSNLLDRRKIESRAGDCREVIGWGAELTNTDYSWLCNERRALSPRFAAAEFLWYMSGKTDVDLLLKYAPKYKEFTDDGVHAYGAYGPRISESIMPLVTKLRADPATRQAVVLIWRAYDLVAVTKDVPCTVSLQFFVRDERLILHTHMRSNDAWLGFPHDVWSFTCLQRVVAGELGLPVGKYVHTVGSMHLYEKNVEAAVEATASYWKSTPRKHNWLVPTNFQAIRNAVLAVTAQDVMMPLGGSMAYDLAELYRGGSNVHSLALKQGLIAHDNR